MPVYKSKDKTKDGKQWFFMVSYVDLQGNRQRYKSKKYIKQGDAEDAEAEFRIKSKETYSKSVTFNELYLDYLSDFKSRNKESSYYGLDNTLNKFIVSFFKNKKIKDITIIDVKRWQQKINEMKKDNGDQYSLRYRKELHISLVSILNYGIKFYSLDKNVASLCGNIKEKSDAVCEEKIRYITYDQFKKFISVIDDITWKAFFTTLYFAGLRRGEAQALNWTDINFKDKCINVYKTLSVKTTNDIYKITNTKTGKNRKVILDDKTCNCLKELKAYQKGFDNFSESWFVFGGVRFLPNTTIDRNKNNFFKKAKLEPITIHEFRHSSASLLINLNYNPIKIAERLGHSERTLKKIYTHLFPDSQDEIVNGINNLK